ncbi:hypothetical protein LINGRAPRIM_LOCUS2467, partial [Linum grandiflorum]
TPSPLTFFFLLPPSIPPSPLLSLPLRPPPTAVTAAGPPPLLPLPLGGGHTASFSSSLSRGVGDSEASRTFLVCRLRDWWDDGDGGGGMIMRSGYQKVVN